MSRRRPRGGPGLVTIYWRDIPAQVTATGADGTSQKLLLEDRFQHAIDRAAGVAGLTDTNDYVNEWRRVPSPVDGDPLAAAQAAVDTLQTEFHRDRLEAFVANGGLDPVQPGDNP